MSIGPLGPGGPGEWDDLFARFFGAAEPRRAQRIDITKYMSNEGRDVLSDAARRAAELADEGKAIADLDTDHLLWAALQQEPLKASVRRAGADPEALLAALGRPSRLPGDALPEQVALTPAAKRALLDSLQVSRALGSSYVGPEHILMALGLNPDSAAGRLMAGKLDPQSLQAAAANGGGGTGGGNGNSSTPTLEQYGVDLTDLARRGEIDPVIGRADEI
ncbi:MAG TPA: Clp protease N-terminal domain-containing protein, partial [Actinoplanes sp.]|nr:Clp protease N-terminal domain-containing protein [Actinoplanes sp.]